MLPDGGIEIHESVQVQAGMNIRPHGSYFAAGDLIIRKGTGITPSDLAALAMGGISRIPVTGRPAVAFIPTGSELIPAGKTAGAGTEY